MSSVALHESKPTGDALGDSWELLPILAYEEEVAAVPKSPEEIVAEKLAALKGFGFALSEPPDSDESGAAVYLDVCNQIHKASYMQFPTTSVAKDLQAQREVLDLSHANLGTKGAVALAAALRVNTASSSLVLTDNDIGPSAGMEIAHAIGESRSITSVDLSNNALGKTELFPLRGGEAGGAAVRGGSVIKELLGHGSTITRLSVRGNALTNSDVSLFADTLAENVNLQDMDLSDNKLGPSAATALAGVLSRNSDLRTINLEWNPFGPAACRTLLADGFLQNNTIKSFNLSACGLDDVSAQLIARIISENATEEITIANNNISSAGAQTIAKAFSPDSSLVSLVMDGNNIGDAGCLAVVTAAVACFGLGDANGSSTRTFQLLSLRHCGCSEDVERQFRPQQGQGNHGIHVSEGFGNMILS